MIRSFIKIYFLGGLFDVNDLFLAATNFKCKIFYANNFILRLRGNNLLSLQPKLLQAFNGNDLTIIASGISFVRILERPQLTNAPNVINTVKFQVEEQPDFPTNPSHIVNLLLSSPPTFPNYPLLFGSNIGADYLLRLYGVNFIKHHVSIFRPNSKYMLLKTNI